jgi:hypothetical protein
METDKNYREEIKFPHFCSIFYTSISYIAMNEALSFHPIEINEREYLRSLE